MTTSTETSTTEADVRADRGSEYRVTFGQQYPREPHPYYDRAHRDGFVTVVAPDYLSARALVIARLGVAWSDLYALDSGTEWGLFPLGELDRWVVPPEFAQMFRDSQ
jgi:hypothetical protein